MYDISKNPYKWYVYLDNLYHEAEWKRESGEDEDDADDNQHY